MAFTTKNLTDSVRGDDWSFRLTFTSGGAPLDISGYTFYFTMKLDIGTADPGELQITSVAAGADALAGIYYIVASKAQTAVLVPGTYSYDVQQTNVASKDTTLLLGKIKVVADVTQTTV
jgi:hypothetical protein